jgi:hypothetical protein
MDTKPYDIYKGNDIVPFYGQNAHTERSVLPWGRSAKEMMIMPLSGNGEGSDKKCQSLLENQTTII